MENPSTADQFNTHAPRLAWNDALNLCLGERMKSLLGNVQHLDTEPVRVIKYQSEQKLQVHYDWFPGNRNETGRPGDVPRVNNRLGSIFAYVEDDCDGGETFFPEVTAIHEDADETKFSRTESDQGLLVKARRGNAIFWNNMHLNGSGDVRTAHAGMPVTRGTKVGINIWSYYFPDKNLHG